MNRIYLFGDFNDYFKNNCSNFIASCGGSSAVIALLMQGEKEWQKYFKSYENIFRQYGVGKIIPIFPGEGSLELKKRQLKLIDSVTGILVGGGYTYRYIRIYTQDPVAGLIRSKYEEGIPYGGVSAGAILSIRLGLLDNCAVKPHFTAKNRYFELLRKMKTAGSIFGIGLDSGICLEIINGRDCKVFGEGRLYLYRKISDSHFDMFVFKRGNSFVCNFSDPGTLIR